MVEYDVRPQDILAVFGAMFPLILRKEIVVEMKKLDADLKSQMAELGKGKKSRNEVGGTGAAGGDEADEADDSAEPKGRSGKNDDEGSEIGDGDAAGEKRRRQAKQVATYESDEDEDEDSEGEFGDAGVEAAYADNGESGDENEDGEKMKKKSKVSGSLKAAVEKVEQEFLEHFPQATSFKFTESGCTIELEVGPSFSSLRSHIADVLPLSSSARTCPSCFSWASSSAPASRLSFVKFRTSQTVSACARRARTVVSRYAPFCNLHVARRITFHLHA